MAKVTFFQSANKTAFNSYLAERCNELGISPKQAKAYGLSEDKHGNIIQTPTNPDGHPYTYFDDKAYQKIESRKSAYNLHEDAFNRPWQIIRTNPEALKKNPNLSKYKHPAGAPVKPMFLPRTVEAYKQEQQGGTLYITEGLFKGISLDLNGFLAVAVSGIGMYKVSDELLQVLKVCNFDRVVLLYDRDAKDLKQKEGVFTTNRLKAFNRSPEVFARQFFAAAERHGISTKLYFAMIAPSAPKKGVDDLLNSPDCKEGTIKELQTVKAGAFIDAFRLFRTTYDYNLRRFFGTTDHRAFYAMYGQQIGENAFSLHGRTWQPVFLPDLLSSTPVHFRLLNDPYKVEAGTIELSVDKYLAEQKAALIEAVKSEGQFLAIDAPTGAGKTTFCAQLAAELDTPIVIAVPTKAIARQQAAISKEYFALFGTRNRAKAQRAGRHKVVFCTYDTVHHLPDLRHRILVIDEAHELVNAFDYRHDAIDKLMILSKQSRKVILLSGTMPDLLPVALDAQLIKIKREQSNKVRLHTIESSGRSLEKLTEDLTDELLRCDFSGDKVHFAYVQSTKELKAIKSALVKAGKVKAEEVSILARQVYEGGEVRVLDTLTKKEAIEKGIKLVLTTCIISTGVNIKNKNIGRVYYVGHRCADNFRQFVARFRMIPLLDVIVILPAENGIGDGFLPSDITADLRLKSLELQARAQLAGVLAERKAIAAELDPDELLYEDQIRHQAEGYKSKVFPFVADAGGGRMDVSTTALLYELKAGQLEGTNNDYFLQQVTAADNIDLYGFYDAKPTARAKEAIKEAKEAAKEAEAEAMAETTKQLSAGDVSPIAQLHTWYVKRGSRAQAIELKQLAGDAVDFSEANTPDSLEYKPVRKAIKAFAQMLFAGISQEERATYLADLDTWADHWRKLQAMATRHRFNSKQQRKTMHELHRLEAKGCELIEKQIEAGKVYSPAQLAGIIAPVVGETESRPSDGKPRATMAAKRAMMWANKVFHFEQVRRGSRPLYKATERVYYQRNRKAKKATNFENLQKSFDKIKLEPARIKALSEFG